MSRVADQKRSALNEVKAEAEALTRRRLEADLADEERSSGVPVQSVDSHASKEVKEAKADAEKIVAKQTAKEKGDK